jgi:molybdate transport system substrate-binding protein
MTKSALVKKLALVLFLLNSTVAMAGELTVLAGSASRTAVSEIGPLFEKISGHTLDLRFANNPILKQQIEAGAKFDVLIIEPEMLEDLVKHGHVSERPRTDVARVGMALLARVGAAKANISNLDTFKTVLRSAESVGYNADTTAGTIFLRTLEQLGLMQEMKPRLRPVIAGSVQQMVAKGDVHMYAGPVSTPTPGTAVVGFFPEEIQTYIVISVGLSAMSTAPDVARTFFAFITSPEAASIFAKKGFQPMPAR